jgi:hypothetical protein
MNLHGAQRHNDENGSRGQYAVARRVVQKPSALLVLKKSPGLIMEGHSAQNPRCAGHGGYNGDVTTVVIANCIRTL